VGREAVPVARLESIADRPLTSALLAKAANSVASERQRAPRRAQRVVTRELEPQHVKVAKVSDVQ